MFESRTDPQMHLRLALGQVLERYRGPLLRKVATQVGRELQSKVDPADLVQEAFLKVVLDFPRFRGETEGELLAWLRQLLATTLATTVRRYCGTQRRAVHRECPLPDSWDRPLYPPDHGPIDPGTSPSDQAEQREQVGLLNATVAALPADYREILRLRYEEGLTFPEIARRLNRSLDSIKKAWMRALARLRASREFGARFAPVSQPGRLGESFR